MATRKANATKLLVLTMLIALLSASMISMASAAPEEDGTQVPAEGDSAAASDSPTLYATEENVTTTSDDNPVLIQQRDNDTNTTNGDPSAHSAEDTQSEDTPPLIAPQPTSDNTAVIVASIAAVAAVAVGASVAVIRSRKK